jgi:hypothetical protein
MWKRLTFLADRPFATALGGLLLASMIVTLANIGLTADALESLVPRWLLTLLSVTYGIGGLLILDGVMFRRGNSEAAGCSLVASGLVVRFIALITVLGVTAATVATGVFYLVFCWACLERVRQIVHGERIIHVEKEFHVTWKEEADDSGNGAS